MPCLRQEIAAHGREVHTAGRTPKQGDAKRLLELLDTAAKGRLGNAELMRGLMESSAFGDRDEGPQIAQINLRAHAGKINARIPAVRRHGSTILDQCSQVDQ